MSSYTPPDRSTYDPGWNDPPPMPTAPIQSSGAGKPRINLNKRVAFPMQSSGASNSNVKTTAEGLPLPFSTAKYQPTPTTTAAELSPSLPSAALPPPPPSTAVFNPSESTSQLPKSEETFDSSEAQQFCHSIFSNQIEAMTTNIEHSKLSDIRKRLELLNQMWMENKLDEATQKNVYELAKALEKKDATAAMEEHRCLVTQHIHLSTQWATALRQLILSLAPESQSNAQNLPAILTDTETVQFVDVSSRPVVLDSVPPFLQEPANINSMNPIPANDEPNVQESVNDNQNSSADCDVATNERASKSKFGRFGRILHL